MLHGFGYRCQIRIYVRYGYYSIYINFFIYLKDRSIIPIFEYVSDMSSFEKMKSLCNISIFKVDLKLKKKKAKKLKFY